MKPLLPLLFLAMAPIALAQSAPPPGATFVSKIEWKQEGFPPGIALKQVGDRPSLSVEKANDTSATYPVWHSSEPGLKTRCYALRGSLRYHDVRGAGYLELWSQFPGISAPERYFSRTLAEMGPTKKISGSSDWRLVWIPFNGTESLTLPERLELNLVLPAAGNVELGDFELYQFPDAGAMWAALATDTHGSAVASPNSKKALITIVALSAVGIAGAIGILQRQRQHQRRRERRLERRRKRVSTRALTNID